MNIDHIGIVVRSLEEGIKQWEKTFGYHQETLPVINTRQKVNVIFMKKEGSLTVKLIEPENEKSPIYPFAQKGGGLHHICFKVDDVVKNTDHLKKDGLFVLSPPQPGEAFNNANIAFLLAKNNLNIELIDTHEKAERIHTLEVKEVNDTF